jgi:hypothetical protein
MPVADITHLSLRSRRPRRSLRSWLRDVGREIRFAFDCGLVPDQPAGGMTYEAATIAPLANVVPPDNAVLPFPIRGEVLLAQLGNLLRSRFAGRGGDNDPLLLMVSRGTPPRLTIDSVAHVEFHEHGRAFHLAVEAGPDTTLLLETADIEILAGFVMRYIGEKLAERASLEAAP